jgi:molybdate transport system substrate-binding protein
MPKSICYVEQGATGNLLKGLFERLGIAEQLKGKTKLLPPSNPAAHAVANGEAEIGMTQISEIEILPYAGAELVGPLPGRSSSPVSIRPPSAPVPKRWTPPRRSSNS